MSPSSEETSRHAGQELRVSLEFLSLKVLRFVVAHRRPPRLRNLYIFLPDLSQEHRVMLDLKLLESFFDVQNITHARVAERTNVVLLCERYGGWPTNRAKITQRQGGEKYKKGQFSQLRAWGTVDLCR